jgi:DNA polymerase (family 10)
MVAGDLRRGTETLDQMVLLVLADEGRAGEAVSAAFSAWRPVSTEVQENSGAQRYSIRLEETSVSIWVCEDPEAWGVLSVLATGSGAHIDRLRREAEARSLAFDERGMFSPQGKIPCADEETFYRSLGLHAVSPERREAGAPLVGREYTAPRLIRRSDLTGALHNHSTASDGLHSLEQMRARAVELGLSYLGISEHSQTAAYAGGLDAVRLEAQASEIDQLNGESETPACRLLHGIESDILKDGTLDYEPTVLARLEFVVASVHQRYGLGPEEMTQRMVCAASNPWSDIIGHPTGRLLLGRDPAEFDVRALLDACVMSGCSVELNGNPARLDLKPEHLAMAKERGLLVSIAADAHSVEALDHLDYGVTVARRAGLTPDDVLNCRPLEALSAWLQERKRLALASS